MLDPVAPVKPPKRLLRRLLRWLAVPLTLVVVVVAGTPALLSTTPARQLLVQKVGAMLDPGRIELGGAAFTWNQGVVLKDVVLLDPQGKTVATAESVRMEKGLLGLLFTESDYGVIHVEGATADFERREDGSIDVLEAISGLTRRDGDEVLDPSDAPPAPAPVPGFAATVFVKGGRARIASPELAEPILADGFDGQVTLTPGKPVDVVIQLQETNRSLDLRAEYALTGASDLNLTIQTEDWPLAVHQLGVQIAGRFAGRLATARTEGRWSLQSDAVLRETVADAALLAGDRLSLEEVSTVCDLVQTSQGWSIRSLDLKSPLGELSGSGEIPATSETPSRLTGRIDLATASKRLPHAIPLREGVAIDQGEVRIDAELNLREGTERLTASAEIAGLKASEGGRPLSLHRPASLQAVVVRREDAVTVESFAMNAAGIDASGQGELDKGVKLSGTVDLEAVEAQVRELIELGETALAGEGRMAADYRFEEGRFKARLATEFQGLRIVGITADPIERARARIDAAAEGPCGERGEPTGWRSVRLVVDAGETKASLLAEASEEAPVSFTFEGSTPITSPAPGVVSAKTTLHRIGEEFELTAVELSANPNDPTAASASLGIVAKGRLNPTVGRLVLIPEGPQPSPGIAVGPQGFMLTGLGKPEEPMSIDTVLQGDAAALDQALAYWLQTSYYGLGGSWTGRATLARQPDGRIDFNGWANSPDLTLTTSRGPVSLAASGAYTPGVDHLGLASLDLTTNYGRLYGGGTIAEVSTKQFADITGSFEPRWETIDSILATSVEPNAHIRATVKPFHLRSSLAAGSISQILKATEGVLAVDLESAQAFGMRVGPTPVALRLGGGAAVFDPISTTLNGGAMVIGADLFVDDPAALWLRLHEGSRIEGAAINKNVSDDVLSFIAPVLSDASNVSGAVSLTIQGAAIPLIGDGALNVDGQLVFQDVIFQPGPLASELVALTGRTVPSITLEQPLQLQIAEGRVTQSGLTIPLGDDLTAKIAGSVGFDQTLALKATVPLTPQMIGNDAVVQQFVGGTEIPIPIGGTISRPTIDRNGLRLALREATRSMVRRGVQAEAGRLLDRVLPPGAGDGEGNAESPGASIGRELFKALEGGIRERQRPQPQPRRR